MINGRYLTEADIRQLAERERTKHVLAILELLLDRIGVRFTSRSTTTDSTQPAPSTS